MQLSSADLVIISELKSSILSLKDPKPSHDFILPSINIFSTAIAAEVKEQLKAQLVLLGIQDASYQGVVAEYHQQQAKYLSICIDAIIQFITAWMENRMAAESGWNRLLLFMETDQISHMTLGIEATFFAKINPAMMFRLMYFLTDIVYTFFAAIKNQKRSANDAIHEHVVVKKMIERVAEGESHIEKRRQLYPLFFSELHIREASILASGDLVHDEQISDIFTVYKTAAYGIIKQEKHPGTATYYNLAVKTLLHLSQASQLMQANPPTSHLSFNINPIHEETVLGRRGLTRTRCFGIQISHEEGQALLPLNSTDIATTQYPAPTYKLSTGLKIAFLSHIQRLNAQLNTQVKHIHTQRRIEKSTALQEIIDADEKAELSPATFTQVKSDKPYLFVAWWASKTLRLIEQGEYDLKIQMWEKLSRDSMSIGQFGYAIEDKDLLQALVNKYQELAGNTPYDANKKISNILCDLERSRKSGYTLWRFDKKMALEYILIAHAQQLLHPALIREIEENYPQVYARSLPLLRKSAVESIIKALKEHLISQIWADAAADHHTRYANAVHTYA